MNIDKLKENSDFLISSKYNIPCKRYISKLPSLMLSSWMDSLAFERLERKSNDINAHLKEFKNSWDEVFYIMLSRNFGFGTYSYQFELLALSLPLKYILKHGDSLFQIEALLYGQAGFLEDDRLKSENDSEEVYYLSLKNEYAFLKKKYKLNCLNPSTFKDIRIRPASSPLIRISQLAALLHKWGRLFSKIIEKKKYDEITSYFKIKPSEYWQTHYSFGKQTVNSDKFISKTSLDILMINTVVPILFAYGKNIGSEVYCDRALNILERMYPERNSIVREFSDSGLVPKSAFHSQALIQLMKEYCDNRRCIECRIGYKVITLYSNNNMQ